MIRPPNSVEIIVTHTARDATLNCWERQRIFLMADAERRESPPPPKRQKDERSKEKDGSIVVLNIPRQTETIIPESNLHHDTKQKPNIESSSSPMKYTDYSDASQRKRKLEIVSQIHRTYLIDEARSLGSQLYI